MLRKICPICEQTMTLSHYCQNCRQFVKTPYVRDFTYYLNERHPEGETSCDYHGITKEKGQSEPSYSRPDVRPSTFNPVPQESAARFGGAWGRMTPPSMIKQKKSRGFSGRKVVFAIIGFAFLMQIMGSVIGLMRGLFFSSEYSESQEYRLLSDEEVLEQGNPCNSNGHYSVSGTAARQEMEKLIKAAGYEINNIAKGSCNYEDTSEQDLWTDYDTTVAYRIEKTYDSEEEPFFDLIMVNYDTVTEQLHGINFYLSEPETAADMAEEVLRLLQEQGDILSDEDYAALVKDKILKYLDRDSSDDDTEVQQIMPGEGEGQTKFYFYEREGDYYMRIWKMWD